MCAPSAHLFLNLFKRTCLRGRRRCGVSPNLSVIKVVLLRKEGKPERKKRGWYIIEVVLLRKEIKSEKKRR